MSGFYGTPVSKGFTYLTLGASVLCALGGGGEWQRLSSSALLGGQWWRLVTSQLAYGSTGELVIGMMLGYMGRTFERRMGSRKFGAFLLVSTAVSMSLQAAVLLRFPALRAISGGPYGVIFSIMVLYYACVPKIQPRLFGVLGLDFSNKGIYYLLGLQLMLNDGWRSAVPSLSGLMAGCAYRSHVTGLSNWRVPAYVVRLLAPLGALLETRRPPGLPGDALPPEWRAGDGVGANGGHQERLIGDPFGGAWGRNAAPAAQALTQPPPEESIEVLVQMGFSRDAALRALQRSGNDVQRAANVLLAG